MMRTGRSGSSMVEPADLHDLLAVVDAELGNIVSFILRRCGNRALAEDLAADVILRAVRETKRTGTVVTPAWLTTVARNRLVDHWRARAGRSADCGWPGRTPTVTSGLMTERRWSSEVVNQVIRTLPADYQAVLALRYLDDLSVPSVADALGRSVHATESLLARARRAFRTSYLEHDRD